MTAADTEYTLSDLMRTEGLVTLTETIKAEIYTPSYNVVNHDLASAILLGQTDKSRADWGCLKYVGSKDPEAMNYTQVMNGLLGADTYSNWQEANVFSTDNIPKGGYKLLKEYVNLFLKLPKYKGADISGKFRIRVLLDYTVEEVPLSSLLVWREQLDEFLPKSTDWRGSLEAAATLKPEFEFLISRGSVKTTGSASDPTNKTGFPDIDS